MTDADVYVSPEDYDAMIAALAKRCGERDMSYAELEATAGVASGFIGKAFGPSSTKRLGWLSTFLVLPALGLRLALIEDPEAAHRFAERAQKRNAGQARIGNHAQRVSDRVVKRAVRHLVTTCDWNEILATIAESRREIAAEQEAKEARQVEAAVERTKSPSPAARPRSPKRIYFQSAKTRLRTAVAVSATKRARAGRNKTPLEKSNTARNDSTERAGAI